MKHFFSYIILLLISLCFTSCVDTEEQENTPQGNFEALWKIIDEHYCFFDYKQQTYGLDWNAIHEKYKVRISADMTSDQLFEVLTAMLAELKDGHVNLSRSADYGRYWSWYESYPSNYSDTLIQQYLGTDYKIASSLKYRILDSNIGYIRYESFTSAIGDGNIDEVLNRFQLCQGLIIDIRNNGGGNLTYAEKLAARFFNQSTLVGYIQHKTGSGHQDFSDLKEQRIETSSSLRWHKPVCILTNRKVFSAANEFVKYMKCSPLATIVGDHTGGGSGLPFNSMLPNGWNVRFSACPMYDSNKQQTEFGLSPDVSATLTLDDINKGIDPIIEKAIEIITNK